jgi:hypothetical protein
MTPVNVPVGNATVVALLFDTDRVPFVVKVEKTDRLEVPWRGSTSIRSARRDELLRLLSPLQRSPIFEVLSGSLSVSDPRVKDKPSLDWQIVIMLYVVPSDSGRLVLPYHSCKCILSFPEHKMRFELGNVWIELWGHKSATLFVTGAELIVEGPGMFLYRVIQSVPGSGVIPGTDAHLRLELKFVGIDRPVVVETVIPAIIQKPRHWAVGKLKDEIVKERDAYGG